MHHRAIFFLSILFLYCTVSFYSHAAEVIPLSKSEHIFIGKYTQFLEDTDQSMTISDAWDKWMLNEFNNHDQDVFAKPATPSSYWFSFCSKNTLKKTLWVNLNNSNLDSIHYYKVDMAGNLISERITGAFLDKETRAHDSYTFWFPLSLSNDTIMYNYFFKVYSEGYYEVPILIGTFQQLNKYKTKNHFLSIFFLGAMSLMFVYNCFIFFATNDRIYLFYVLYIIGITLNTTFFNNYPIVESFLGVNFSHKYAAVWITPGFIFLGLFSFRYLELKLNSVWTYRVILLEMSFLVVIALANLFIPIIYITNLLQTTLTFFVLTCLFSGYFVLYKGVENATLYSIGWSIMILTSLSYMAVVNGLLPYNFISRNIMYIGIMLEVVVFSIALARRINYSKQGQEVLNLKLLQKNKELMANNESLDSFNYHVSHDLKTVLINCSAMAKKAKQYNDVDDYNQLKEIVNQLLETTSDGISTVQRFLNLAAPDSIVKLDDKEYIEFESEVQTIITKYDLGEKIEVKVKIKNHDRIYIHKIVLETILFNLFTNTIKFNEHFPKANIEVINSDHLMVLTYVDNSKGAEFLVYEGNKFLPQKKSSESNGHIYGLGLYSVKKMVDVCNGEMKVESIINEGVKFEIHLPLNIN